jgi:hypothetical protein
LTEKNIYVPKNPNDKRESIWMHWSIQIERVNSLNDSMGVFSKNLFRFIRSGNKKMALNQVSNFKVHVITYISDYDKQKFPNELMKLKRHTYKYYCHILNFVESIEKVVNSSTIVSESENAIISEVSKLSSAMKFDEEIMISELNSLNIKYSLDKITLE